MVSSKWLSIWALFKQPLSGTEMCSAFEKHRKLSFAFQPSSATKLGECVWSPLCMKLQFWAVQTLNYNQQRIREIYYSIFKVLGFFFEKHQLEL